MTRLAKVVISIIFTIVALVSWNMRPRDYAEHTMALDKSLKEALQSQGLADEHIFYTNERRFRAGRDSFLGMERRYRTSDNIDEEELHSHVEESLERSRFRLIEYGIERSHDMKNLTISLGFKNRILYTLVISVSEARLAKRRESGYDADESRESRIGIVLDDFGYNTNNIEALFNLGAPITLSILPDLPFSKKIAEMAHKNGLEVILHLPLEPHENLNLEKGTLMVDMDKAHIKDLLSRHIDTTPFIKGVSNHMGSKATEDYNFVNLLFKELKKRDLYFLDNLVTNKSVCTDAACDMDLEIATRNVFLDNESDKDYIKRQIMLTAELADKNGWAIGVGHDRKNTVEALQESIPQLRDRGFKFVYISELVL